MPGHAPQMVKTDAPTRETTVRSVYASGDAGSPVQSAILASSSGANATHFVNHALTSEDAEADASTKITGLSG